MRMQPDFEKANEIYFRLGIIYKQQTKYQESLEVRIPMSWGGASRLFDVKRFVLIECSFSVSSTSSMTHLVH